jgi:ornithine carbamoyltransferase
MMKHFIDIADVPVEELSHTLDVSARLKRHLRQTGRNETLLAGKTLAMIFEKPSLRTRVSFSVAMTQLGGNGLVLRDDEVGLGKREAIQDVARVLAGMCDGIMVRTFSHENATGLAKWSNVPVINGLTDYSHPCQAMADLMTLKEHFGDLKNRTLAFIGDGNNVARSLADACGKFGMKFILASPGGYELPKEDMERVMSHSPGMDFIVTHDPIEAVESADCLYTDTWVSMGQEQDTQRKVKEFAGFCIDANLLSKAPKHAVVLHCLPAYRGLEISDEVMEGKQSLVFQQAENRLHFQKGLIAVLLGKM